MIIDINEIKEKYTNYIFGIVSARLKIPKPEVFIPDSPELDDSPIHRLIYERVLNNLAKLGEIRADHGERSLMNLIRKITNARCIDLFRNALSWQKKREKAAGMEACTADRERQFDRWRYRRRLEDIHLKEKYVDILMARSEGLGRKEIGRRFGLTEQQVKIRLEYGRKLARRADAAGRPENIL